MSASSILSETAIIDAEGCPQVIRDCADRPWHYIGDVPLSDHATRWFNAMCGSRQCLRPMRVGSPLLCDERTMKIVHMPRYLFVTDDMLAVNVYLGRCEECGAVYWAKQGPPFRRLRSFVEASA